MKSGEAAFFLKILIALYSGWAAKGGKQVRNAFLIKLRVFSTNDNIYF